MFMSKRSFFKSALAAILVLTLVLGTALGAFAADNTITGSNDVVDVPFEMEMQKALNFSIDPYMYKSDGQGTGQSYQVNSFLIANITPAPVGVTYKMTLAPAADVNLVAAPANVATDNSKSIYFAAMASLSAPTTNADKDTIAQGDDKNATYNFGTSSSVVSFAEGSQSTDPWTADISFALAPAKFSVDALGDKAATALADNGHGVAAFKFYAALNDQATYTTNDLTVGGTIDMRAYTSNAYNALTFSDGWHMIGTGGPGQQVGYMGDFAGKTTTNRYTISKAAPAGDSLDFFFFGTETAPTGAQIEIVGEAGQLTRMPLATTTYVMEADKILFHESVFATALTGMSGNFTIFINCGGVEYPFYLNLTT